MKVTVLALSGLLAVSSVAADDYIAAKNTVNQIASEVLLLAGNESLKEDELALVAQLEEKVLVFVDLETMSKFVLGKAWKVATPDQKQRFISGFKRMLMTSYAKSVVLLKDMKIDFVPPSKSVC